MAELTYMDPWEHTDKKVRWKARIGESDFEFYIPKWRVPTPWPKYIIVTVSEDDGAPESSAVPIELLQPIVAIVERTREHTKTVRYTPRGDRKAWQIGEPYIPYEVLPPGAPQSVRVEVRWEFAYGVRSSS